VGNFDDYSLGVGFATRWNLGVEFDLILTL
nr:mammary-derived growth inhibitor homolog - bovine (fragments) [Bos taurus]